MRKWEFVWVVALLFGLAIPAAAQGNDEPRCNVEGGYYYVHASVNVNGTGGGTGAARVAPQVQASSSDPTFTFNFNGGGGQFACNLNSWLGGVGDFAGYTTSSNGVNGTIISYMFGPRVTLPGHTFQPFVQALFGGAHADASLSGTSGGQSAFAMTVGGGVDINLTHHIFVRPVQAEYFMTRFNIGTNNQQNNFRYSAGVGFRFP